MSKDQIIITTLTVLSVLLIIWAVLYQQRSNRQVRDTQRTITDRDLLSLFEQQAGGLVSSKMITEKSGLTKTETTSRLTPLVQWGMLRAGMNPSGTNYFYELTAPLEEYTGPKLSDEAFLTIRDLQHIFEAYDHKVSPQDLLMATGLPWNIIAREIKYFRKEKVLEYVTIARPDDSPIQFVLLEPYNTPETLDLKDAERLDQRVKEVLYDENLLV